MNKNSTEKTAGKIRSLSRGVLRAAMLASLWLGFNASAAESSPVTLKSPNGELVLAFSLKDFGGATGCPAYAVTFNGAPVIVESRLGLEIKGAPLVGQLSITGKSTTSHDSTWQPVYGERDQIRDHYNQLVVDLSVPLNFLDAGKKYTAHIYSHDPSVPTRTKVRIETQPVSQDTMVKIPLTVRSGAAIRVVLNR